MCPISVPTPHPIPRIPINLTTAPILAIALLWAAQCLDPAVIRDGFVGTEGVKPYNIIILVFSLAYMAITLDITGILQATAFWVNNKGGHSGWKLYLYFYIMLTFLSILMGSRPVILSGTAFLVYYTEVARLDPYAWIMAEFAAANTASMVLFVGNPTNVCIFPHRSTHTDPVHTRWSYVKASVLTMPPSQRIPYFPSSLVTSSASLRWHSNTASKSRGDQLLSPIATPGQLFWTPLGPGLAVSCSARPLSSVWSWVTSGLTSG
jgi:hypothetical protein